MPYDPTRSHLEALAPRAQLLAIYLVTAARNAGIPLIITSSRRTYAEQIKLFAQGRTRTLNSKHLRGEAFDIDISGWSRSSVPSWLFDALGEYGEFLGLAWGGRWKSFPDPGHFEI